MKTTRQSVDNTIVNFKEQDEGDNSNLQVIFSNSIAKGNYKNPSTYKKVAALLLCWEGAFDDLISEVEALKDVFEHQYHYESYVERIESKDEHKLQVCINAIVANFVHKRDGRDNLLIVYYSGHGRPGKSFGHLELIELVRNI